VCGALHSTCFLQRTPQAEKRNTEENDAFQDQRARASPMTAICLWGRSNRVEDHAHQAFLAGETINAKPAASRLPAHVKPLVPRVANFRKINGRTPHNSMPAEKPLQQSARKARARRSQQPNGWRRPGTSAIEITPMDLRPRSGEEGAGPPPFLSLISTKEMAPRGRIKEPSAEMSSAKGSKTKRRPAANLGKTPFKSGGRVSIQRHEGHTYPEKIAVETRMTDPIFCRVSFVVSRDWLLSGGLLCPRGDRGQ